jgi:hypothetical protein
MPMTIEDAQRDFFTALRGGDGGALAAHPALGKSAQIALA